MNTCHWELYWEKHIDSIDWHRNEGHFRLLNRLHSIRKYRSINCEKFSLDQTYLKDFSNIIGDVISNMCVDFFTTNLCTICISFLRRSIGHGFLHWNRNNFCTIIVNQPRISKFDKFDKNISSSLRKTIHKSDPIDCLKLINSFDNTGKLFPDSIEG